MEFTLKYTADHPWRGQYEFAVLQVRRVHKGFDTVMIGGDEVDSFIIDVGRRPGAIERRVQAVDSFIESGCDDCKGLFACWRCRLCDTKWLCNECIERHECP
jgi:hypothetical protein